MLWHKAIGAGGFGGGKSATFVSHELDDTDTGSGDGEYTFSSLALGAAHPDRRILVGVLASRLSGSTASLVSAPTVAGVTSTVIASTKVNWNTSNTYMAEWYIAAVPTGTTGDVFIHVNGDTRRGGVILYRLVGFDSYTASDAQTNTASGTTSVTMNVPADSYTFGISMHRPGGVLATGTWTGLTEDVDQVFDGGTIISGHAAFGYDESANATKSVSLAYSTVTNSNGAGLSVVTFA